MIRIEELHKVFDLWIDKIGSPYFTSAQKDVFFNQAAIQFVNRFFKNHPSKIMEDTSVDAEDVSELIFQVTGKSDSKGDLLIPSDVMYILSVSCSDGAECGGPLLGASYARHNDINRLKKNSFKKPTDAKPKYLYYSDKLLFIPEKKRAVSMSVIKYPNQVTLDDPLDSGTRGGNAVDLNLPYKVINEVVYLSLVQAGLNIRENDFIAGVSGEAERNI